MLIGVERIFMPKVTTGLALLWHKLVDTGIKSKARQLHIKTFLLNIFDSSSLSVGHAVRTHHVDKW